MRAACSEPEVDAAQVTLISYAIVIQLSAPDNITLYPPGI